MKNTCIKCKESWNVPTYAYWVKLDTTDRLNISNYNQLYSVCEDCNQGECISIDFSIYKK